MPSGHVFTIHRVIYRITYFEKKNTRNVNEEKITTYTMMRNKINNLHIQQKFNGDSKAWIIERIILELL